MKNEPMKITVRHACSEAWDAMSPAAKGRHCAACQKTVIDFTGMRDADVLDVFKKSEGGVCGRFHTSQLNRELILPAEQPLRHIFAKKLAAGLLLMQGVISTVTAQQRQTAPQGQSARAVTSQEPITLAGIVTDQASGKPLQGMTVAIAGQQNSSVVTDANGRFRYQCDNITMPSITLRVTDSTGVNGRGSGTAGATLDTTIALADVRAGKDIAILWHARPEASSISATQIEWNNTVSIGISVLEPAALHNAASIVPEPKRTVKKQKRKVAKR